MQQSYVRRSATPVMIARLGLWWPLLVVLVASVRLDDDVIDNPKEQDPPLLPGDAKKAAIDAAGLLALQAEGAKIEKMWHIFHTSPVWIAKRSFDAGLKAGGSSDAMMEAAVRLAENHCTEKKMKPLRVAEWIMESAKICGAGPLKVAEIASKLVMARAASKEEGVKTAIEAIITVQGKGDIPAKHVAKSVSIIALAAGASQEQAAKAAAEAAREMAVKNGKSATEVGDAVAKACLDNYLSPLKSAHVAGVAAAKTAVEHGTERDTAVYFAGNAAEAVAGPGPHVDRAIKSAKAIIYNQGSVKESTTEEDQAESAKKGGNANAKKSDEDDDNDE